MHQQRLTYTSNKCDQHAAVYTKNDNSNIDIITFNCNGFKSSQLEIQELTDSHDSICLQETWLDKIRNPYFK